MFYCHFYSSVSPTEATLQRIQDNPSVEGFLVVDPKGIVKRSSVDLAHAGSYKAAARKLVSAAQYTIKNLDPRDELKFVRVRTRSSEIMLGPENGDTLVVIQNVPLLVPQLPATDEGEEILEKNYVD